MKRFKDWFYNLKIKNKLTVAAFAVIINLLMLLWISSYFYRTTSVFTMMIDAERVHTLKFQRGLEAFQVFVNTGDESYYKKAVKNITEANAIAIPIASVDSIVKYERKENLRQLFLKNYSHIYGNNKERVELMANRVYLFVKLRIPAIEKMFLIVRSGLNTGEEILQLMKEYKVSENKMLIQKINKKSDNIAIFYHDYSHQIDNINKLGMNLLLYLNALIIILLALLSYFIVIKISHSISKPVDELVKNFKEIEKGNLQLKIEPHSNDEIGILIRSFNGIQSNLQGFLKYAQLIAAGKYSTRLTPRSEKDEISIALNVMAENLEKNEKQINTDNWLRDGLAKLNTILNSDKNPTEMATESLAFLINYTGALAGTLYFRQEQNMKLLASYGLIKDIVPGILKKGGGLTGQVWANGKKIHVSNIHEKGFKIFSSSGEYFAKEAIIKPLLSVEEEPIGIVEIASMKKFDAAILELVDHVASPLATALQIADARKKITVLLEETQQQAEELETQQEELRAANAELEEQTTLLRQNEKKLQEQQEELKVSNEELEERTHDLEMQRKEILAKNAELKKMQQGLEQKAEQLELASKYKSEFLANMSHELRTPLNSMLILSKDLSNNKKGNLIKDQVESAEIIYNAGNDLLNLINDILDLSKIESGKMKVSPVYTSVSEIERGLQNIFEHVAKQRGIYFNIEIDENVQNDLFTDRQRFEQIIKNLISNALKFTKNGGVTVRFRENKDASLVNGNNNPSLCVDVIDTGIGIPKDKQQAIFEAFQQADGSISRKFGGTGLGLSISRQLAHKLGGNIYLKSEYGKGSVFTVCIPASFEDKDSDLKHEQKNEKKSIRQFENKEVKPIENIDVNIKKTDQIVVHPTFIPDDRKTLSETDNTILIIEDDPKFAKILLNHCHKNDFKCIVTPSGEDGLALAAKYKPDAISLDIKLPDINGNQVLKRLKENPAIRHIPVQILSAVDGDDFVVDKSIFGFLKKPVNSEDIEATLNNIKKYINRDVKELLIVEDDENTQKTLEKILYSADVNITTTASGEKAYQIILNNKLDCVILDLGIEDMSGLELIKKLNQNITDKNLLPPLIIYTGRDLTKEESRELEKSVSSVIIKGEKSDERLLDETALFLHQVVDKMDDKKKKVINKLHDNASVFEGKKILIVDDDMRNVFALSHILAQNNISVVEAENGLVALKRLEEQPDIDLVLMDVMMPEMDGYTATKKIRENVKFKDLPVITLTAKAMKEDKEKSLEAGASDYLTKPVDVDKLLSLIRVWLYK